jgi:hypothetical protein
MATIEVSRNGEEIFINQMRGACNSLLPQLLQAKLTRWVREKEQWRLPIREPVKGIDSWDDDEIPF